MSDHQEDMDEIIMSCSEVFDTIEALEESAKDIKQWDFYKDLMKLKKACQLFRVEIVTVTA